MRTVLRSLVLVGVLGAALALTAPAPAAYVSPRFEVVNPSERLGGGGPLTLKLSIGKDDDPTFRIVMYIPQGYGAQLGQTFGTQVGSVEAQINARAISPDAIVPVAGAITTVDPAPFRTAPGAIGCNQGVTTFDAVLNVALTAAGQTLNVPIYVFTIREGPEALFAVAKLVVCFAPPDLPPPVGAALGAKLLNGALTLTNVFVNPLTAGNYRWRALFTPYVPGQAAPTPNAVGTVEAQSIDTLPAQLTLAIGKYNKRTKRVGLSGSLTENSVGVGGARVQLLMGRTATGVKQFTTVTTNARGVFSASARIARKALYFFRARVVVPTREAPCEATFGQLGIQCIAANRSGFTILNNRAVSRRLG